MSYADLAYKAHMAAMALSARSKKDDDCGCGCEGAGNCNETWRRLRYMKRILPNNESAMLGLIKGRQDIVDTKAALHSRWTGGRPVENDLVLLPTRMSVKKVGLVGSSSRTGQALQAIASVAIPGDISDIRSPIRSTVYETITPGGGGGSRSGLTRIGGGAARQARRCPAGFENGGRFANRTFSNCGSQLFDLVEEAVENIAGAATSSSRNAEQGAPSSAVVTRDVEAGPYGGSPIAIQRAARIPPYVRANNSKFKNSVDSAIAAAGAVDGDFLRLIRKDGVSLSPVASLKNIARQKNNPDISGSAVVVSARSMDSFGGDEISLFASGVSEIHYVVPGGGSFTLKVKKPINGKQAGALRRKIATTTKRNEYSGTGLSEVAESDPNLTLSSKFDHIDDHTEMIVIERGGIRRSVQKWAFFTWYSQNAPGRPKTQKPWRQVEGADPVE